VTLYERPVVEVARALLGGVVRCGETAGVIVETEAYHHSEPACHAYVGLTARTSTLFGPPGIAYVYRSYGIHALLNVVCEPEDVGAAVLIRALEPVSGLGLMRARRGSDDLCSGPGKLTQALGISIEMNGTSLTTGPVRLEPPRRPLPAVVGTRIGITKGVELQWRFCAAGARDVSRPWPPGLLAA
jgi:DNA-3-methyladenine glycosylase